MFVRFLTATAIFGTLVTLAGCDPDAIIERKVPKPVRELLTFAPPPAGKKGPTGEKARQAILQILSPTENAAFPSGRPVLFRADARFEGHTIKEQDVQWMLFEGGAKAGKPIGRGVSFGAPLGPGTYRAEVTLFLPANQKAVKTVNFRVVLSLAGRVIHNRAGLADTELTLTDVKENKVISRARTDKNGAFFIEMPPAGIFKLTPGKEGFSFGPPYTLAQHEPKPGAVEFQAAKAQISEVLLTAAEDSREPLQKVCPEQEAYLKAAVQSEAPITALEVDLIPTQQVSEPLRIGATVYPVDTPEAAQAESRKIVKVQIPRGVTRGSRQASFNLRVTARDRNGNAFSVEAPRAVAIDIGECLVQKFRDAVSAHEQGHSETAVKVYSAIEELYRETGGASAFAGYREKNLFNRGLAYLQMALVLQPDDVKRIGYLGKAALDFREALKLNRRDAQAFLLLGLADQLGSRYDGAIDSYGSALGIDPELSAVHELRGRAYLEGRAKKNLSAAVDDFTRALVANPRDKGLRASRRAALNLDIASQDKPDDAPVDISAVPLKEIEQTLNLETFRRK